MGSVKDIMNDLYLAYKRYESTKDMEAWNNDMAGFRQKYPDSPFYEDLAWTFAKQVSRENGY